MPGFERDYERKRRALPPAKGEPCPYCGMAMWPGKYRDKGGRMVSVLEADHYPPRAQGGGGALRWAHAVCNRRAGARLGNSMRKGSSPLRW